MTRILWVVAMLAGVAGVARADGDATRADDAPASDALDLRLTLSSFLYRQSGSDPAPLVDQGASPQNASPVHRLFGDLRVELGDAGLAIDARVRQTTSAHYQSGAEGNGEYDVRTLDYRIGSVRTRVTLGRQLIEAVGSTKIDGISFAQRITGAADVVVFAGMFPMLGSRSLDTDYVHLRNLDGTEGALLLPVAGGGGLTYQAASIHGELGVAGIYAPQDVPDATSDQKTRVFAASSGYWQPTGGFDLYHFALVDLAGADGAHVTNGSLAIDARPVENTVLSVSVNHVSNDVLQISARNLLSDPDPTAIGVVQNNLSLLRISQDMGRAGISVALAARRFELSAFASVHLRPAVTVPLADGSGSVSFPEARSAEAAFTILDRHSIGGTRIALSGSLTEPLGTAAPNRSRGTVLRASVAKAFADQRGEIHADVTVERFADLGSGQPCTGSLNPLACYGTSTTNAAQVGALVSWRVGKEWLLVVDVHAGYQDVRSRFTAATSADPMALTTVPVVWPSVLSITSFVRLQWRYR